MDNPREATSQMMTLETQNTNGVDITDQDVAYQLAIPRQVLKTAAEKAGIAYHEANGTQPLTTMRLQPGALFAPIIAGKWGMDSVVYAVYVLLLGPVSETIAFAYLFNAGYGYLPILLGTVISHSVILILANFKLKRPLLQDISVQMIWHGVLFGLILLPMAHIDSMIIAAMASWFYHSIGNMFGFLINANLHFKKLGNLGQEISELLPPLKLESDRIGLSIQPSQTAKVKLDTIGFRVKLNVLFGTNLFPLFSKNEFAGKINDLVAFAAASNQTDSLATATQFGTGAELNSELRLLSALSEELKSANDLKAKGDKLGLFIGLASKNTANADSRKVLITFAASAIQTILNDNYGRSTFATDWKNFHNAFIFGSMMAQKGFAFDLKDDVALKLSDRSMNKSLVPIIHVPGIASETEKNTAMKHAVRFVRQNNSTTNKLSYLVIVSNDSRKKIEQDLSNLLGGPLPRGIQLLVVAESKVKSGEVYSYDELFRVLNNEIENLSRAITNSAVLFPVWSPTLASWLFSDPNSSSARHLAELILVQMISGSMSIVATLTDVLTDMQSRRAAAIAA
jgi:hypothetical protein